MKKNQEYEINFAANTITVTKKFLQDASIMGTVAFKVMCDLRALNMPIMLHEVHRKKELRWKAEKMERYLDYLDEEYKESYRAAYDTIKETMGYLATWSWFKKTFPNYKKLPALNDKHQIIVLPLSSPMRIEEGTAIKSA